MWGTSEFMVTRKTLVLHTQMNPNHVNLLDPTQVNRLAPSESRLQSILLYFADCFILFWVFFVITTEL